MKIARLHVTNFLGITAVDVATDAPVTLFAGRNGAGKSSLRDAIALALTADLGRVSLKKEAGQLVRAGASAATCEVVDVDGDAWTVTITDSGKIADSHKGREADPVLSYVLDAQRFARLTPVERPAFLFGMLGIKLEPAALRQRIQGRAFAGAATAADLKRMDRIEPLLRSGFPAAHEEAKRQTADARAAWKTVTGEAFGSEKAKTWRAPVPAYDAATVASLTTDLKHIDTALESWQREVGALQAEEQRRATLKAKLPALQEHAAKLGRIEAKLVTDEASLVEWQVDLDKTAAAAGAGPRVGLVHDLAKGLSDLLMSLPTPADTDALAKTWDAALSAMDRYVEEHGAIGATSGDAKAAARLPSVRQSRDLMASAVANDKRDLAAAQQAKAELDSITAELAEVFDAAALENARAQAETFKVKRATTVAEMDKQRAIKAQVDAADAKTKQAAGHAVDVAAWDRLADALAPDGVPGEILAEALAPINERLAQSAADAAWPEVVIAADMAITAGGRDYRLLSESERWRVDAMVAEAVSSLSGTRLLVLDRFDVLDLPGRSELLGWLDTLADNGEIDSALIFGTLKTLPANLPPTIAAHWLENGVCGQLKEAA